MSLDKEDIEQLGELITKSINNSARAFFIDREKHYKHHEFVDSVIKFSEFASKTAWRTVIGGAVLFVMGIMGLGLFAYFKLKGG